MNRHDSIAKTLIFFENEVRAFNSLIFLYLNCNVTGQKVNELRAIIRKTVVYEALSEFEKDVWTNALSLLEDEFSFSHHYSSKEGIADYYAGQRARTYLRPANDNPFPASSYGYHMWLQGWSEQDKMSREDEAYANDNERTEWLEDVVGQIEDAQNDMQLRAECQA
jgi:hypothetical protein